VAWENAEDFPGNVESKVLRKDPGRGAKSMLVRIAPGEEIKSHSHVGLVQHYVLEGSYEAEGKEYGPQVYRCFPPHADIPTISTKSGVTVFMIYDPID
jgi:quercetin dioxygenase-like cupin family protein